MDNDIEFDVDKVKSYPVWKLMDYLRTKEELAAFLTEVLSEPDPGFLAGQLGVICKAHGMPAIAAQTGISREALYKALRERSQPRFETVHKVLAALGLRLVVVAQDSPET